MMNFLKKTVLVGTPITTLTFVVAMLDPIQPTSYIRLITMVLLLFFLTFRYTINKLLFGTTAKLSVIGIYITVAACGILMLLINYTYEFINVTSIALWVIMHGLVSVYYGLAAITIFVDFNDF